MHPAYYIPGEVCPLDHRYKDGSKANPTDMLRKQASGPKVSKMPLSC